MIERHEFMYIKMRGQIDKEKKLDKRKALYKSLQKNGLYFESNKLYENKIPGWIKKYLEEREGKDNEKDIIPSTLYM